MSDAAVGGALMGLIFGFIGFLIGAWLLRVIMLRHIERQLSASRTSAPARFPRFRPGRSLGSPLNAGPLDGL